TLPTLYELYGPAGSASYATYVTDFNDVVGGRSSRFLAAHSGYDGVTGLGSPKVAELVSALSGVASGNVSLASAKSSKATRSNTRRFPVTTGSDDDDGGSKTTAIVTAVNGTMLDLRPLTVAALNPGDRDMLEASALSAATISQATGKFA